MTNSTILPPSCVRGMTRLARKQFSCTKKFPTIDINISCIKKLMKLLRKADLIIRLPNFNNVENIENNTTHKRVIIREISSDFLKIISSLNMKKEQIVIREINFNYSNWTAHQIITAVVGHPFSSFSQIGHIIHLNLNNEFLPQKYLIGEVLLDKTPSAKTVVNKTDKINNVYRNFQLEILAGESNFITTAKENGFTFKMDFSKVYWNTRLGTEHERIVMNFLFYRDLVFDVFSGIGPFAIPAAFSSKRFCTVHANDLNPDSFEWLNYNVNHNLSRRKENIKKNIKTYNMDGRDFIHKILKFQVKLFWTSILSSTMVNEEIPSHENVHVIMNLPALAPEYLDVFNGLYHDDVDLKTWIADDNTKKKLPTLRVYCYAFCEKSSNLTSDDAQNSITGCSSIKKRVESSLNYTFNSVIDTLNKKQEKSGKKPNETPSNFAENTLTLRFVRNVAPNKNMYCAMFVIPWSVLLGSPDGK